MEKESFTDLDFADDVAFLAEMLSVLVLHALHTPEREREGGQLLRRAQGSQRCQDGSLKHIISCR